MSASALRSLWSKTNNDSNAGSEATSNGPYGSRSEFLGTLGDQQHNTSSALPDGGAWNSSQSAGTRSSVLDATQNSLRAASTLPRRGRSPFAANTSPSDVFSSPAESLSPIAPWGPSSSATLSSPDPRTSPEMRAFYGSQTDSNKPSAFGNTAGVTGEDYRPSTLFSHARHFGTEYVPTVYDAADDDVPYYTRDASTLPRRNHTIASSAAAYRRRLDRQFEHGSSSTGLMSPSKNSLSAITGGAEEGDDDWEAMLKRKESLIPNDVDEEHEVLNTAAWRPIGFPDSTSAFATSHRRFPSQPASTFATSPVDPHSPVSVRSGGHQRSESVGINRLDQGPFASSPIVQGSGFGSVSGAVVRRHQSLNHHAGRNAFSRMTAARNPMPVREDRQGGGEEPLANTQRDSQNLRSAHDDRAHRLAHFTYPQPSTQFADPVSQLSLQSLQINDEGQDNTAAAKPVLSTLVTNRDELLRSVAQEPYDNETSRHKPLNGPASASAYVPPIGHGHHRRHSSSSGLNQLTPTNDSDRTGLTIGEGGRHHEANRNEAAAGLRGLQSAHPTYSRQREDQMTWHQRADTPTHFNGSQAKPTQNASSQLPINARPPQFAHPQIAPQSMMNGNAYPFQSPSYYLDPASQAGAAPLLDMRGNVVHAPQAAMHWPVMASTTTMNGLPIFYPGGQQTGSDMNSFASQNSTNVQFSQNPTGSLQDPAFHSLITAKGYNPPTTQFDISAPRARFFVIKSFTEDDVQRSLKHEIWASTEKGNQRLDRAFKESSSSGPLYLLFSVNASGHFCGIAEMLTPLDYSSDSTVWVQEGKWKGTFKVRWIYVKDVPNNRLRHIRLTNTADCKPITQSRDTQELPPDGGRQALKIIAEFPSRTTLLKGWLLNGQQSVAAGDGGKAGLDAQTHF